MGRVTFTAAPLRRRPATAPPKSPTGRTKPSAAQQPKKGLAEGRALKQTLWLPGETATLTERDLEQVCVLTGRSMGIADVLVHLVRCTRFESAEVMQFCVVGTVSRILGAYETTDSCGGVLFRRMTDALCRELIGTLGPFPGVSGRYEPTSAFEGSRRFPSGAAIDSLAAYVRPSFEEW